MRSRLFTYLVVLGFAFGSLVFNACSDQVPLNIKITSQGSAADVLSASAKTGDGKVTLSWQLPSNGKGVTIRRDTAGFPFGPTSGTEVYAGSATSYTDNSVVIGQRYYYLIITIDNNLNFAGGVQKSAVAYDYGAFASNPSTSSDIVKVIVIDGNALYIGGSDRVPSGVAQWRVEKRDKTTGVLDTAFGTAGVLQIDPSGSSNDEVRSMVIDGSSLFIAGSDGSLGASNSQWRIEKRDKNSGALDPTFDGDGILTINPSANNDEIRKILIVGTGLFALGSDQGPGSTNSQWRIEKRDVASGALVGAFGTGGIIQANLSGGADELYCATVDGSALYIGGSDSIPGNLQWRVEKRDATTGALDTGFDGDGILTVNPSVTSSDELYAIAVDGLSLFIAGYDGSPSVSNAQWRIEKRNKATGALDVGFDGDGIVTSNPSVNPDYPNALITDASGIYIAGYDGVFGLGNLQWRIEKRDKVTGALLNAFDTDGIIQYNHGTVSDEIFALWLDGGQIYLGGYESGSGNTAWLVEKRDKDTGAKVSGTPFENP